MGSNINWKGRLGPMRLRISDTTFRPSTISGLLAEVLHVEPGDIVIDVGCGSGILSIIAAKLGASRVHAVDKSPDVVEVGSANAVEHGVADKIIFYQGDLFAPIPDDVEADVIIGDVSGIPDRLADDSGWFPTKGGGGPRGSELPIRMLEEAKRRLRPMGRLFLPTGTLQDEAAIIQRARALYGRVKALTNRPIPLPSQLAASATLKDLIDRKIVTVTRRGSRLLWKAQVWELSPES
ncbi:ribosomal protein L11 methyltransferase [bacterium BMS3Abin02]|nr:ribosomal protein L11 methyltransferase [bacterium BMS3Abin02]GBE22602.1 ribosomal protein L11 methyltransferase [bacterium BMS3Bbin01]HDH25411.1 methyltransferase domain-containing protein [Actinomycetota bacterium]HDK45474.1 methyltransferase domain-containing protein [Actinomycetota bacterium]HDL48927.1 methyltransferase domain-containing protein [Actinomycetota bacterium]